MHEWLFGGALFLTLVAGCWCGYAVLDRVLAIGVTTTENARALLESGDIGKWNAFRKLNSNWFPDLHEIHLQNRNLQDADLSRCNLLKANFENAVLDGADLSNAAAQEAIFTGCSARGAIFDRANLSNAKLDGAILIGASFVDVKPEEQARHALVRDAKPEPKGWAAMSPKDFEALIVKVFQKLGYVVSVPAGAGDQGFDLLLEKDDIAGTTAEIVQTKRVSTPQRQIGADALASLEAARYLNGSQTAYFVTNGEFTLSAKAFAATKPWLKLIDGARLAKISEGVTLSPDAQHNR